MTTGGPEALHQLVNHMTNLGLPAFIVYLPFANDHQTPTPYLKYNAPIGEYEDLQENLIIFPEIYPMLALKVKSAKAALWWLSLDNFLERKNISFIRDKYHYIRAILRGKRPLKGAKSLTNLIHFSQTQHATNYLVSCGITSAPLIDSINEFFLNDNYNNYLSTKKNLILYNPTKGKKITQLLIKTFPQYQFMPLKGYLPEAMAQIFYSAKLYIDFGHHPGRDRMPREAAMHGCCIITNKRGSSGNEIDVPIPSKYKLNENAADFIEQFSVLSEQVMNNFDACTKDFESYRTYLKGEPTIFKQQIANYFCV